MGMPSVEQMHLARAFSRLASAPMTMTRNWLPNRTSSTLARRLLSESDGVQLNSDEKAGVVQVMLTTLSLGHMLRRAIWNRSDDHFGVFFFDTQWSSLCATLSLF